MKEWLTAREIAAEKLPMMPSEKSGVIRMAERENWNDHPYARPRRGRGGGMEYRYLILPDRARIAYELRYRTVQILPVREILAQCLEQTRGDTETLDDRLLIAADVLGSVDALSLVVSLLADAKEEIRMLRVKNGGRS